MPIGTGFRVLLGVTTGFTLMLRAAMTALSAVAHRVAHLPGRLGTHQEFGAELAAMLN